MTDHPAGDPLTAYRRVLARARKAEQWARVLRAQIEELEAQER